MSPNCPHQARSPMVRRLTQLNRWVATRPGIWQSKSASGNRLTKPAEQPASKSCVALSWRSVCKLATCEQQGNRGQQDSYARAYSEVVPHDAVRLDHPAKKARDFWMYRRFPGLRVHPVIEIDVNANFCKSYATSFKLSCKGMRHVKFVRSSPLFNRC